MGGERVGHAGMMENFSALFGGAEPPPPAAATALGFGSGKPGGPGAGPPPAAAAPQTAEDVARKAAAASGPFYLMRELPGNMELTGSTNLITHYNLEHSYNKFCGKKVKEKLSNFLPDLPGMIDLPGSHDNSSLRSLIEKPPICSSSFNPITGTMLTGFRLHAGPLPEQCRLMHIQPPKKKNKHKHKQSRTQDPVPPETPSDSDHKKKKKKKEEDPERKRKKKEKKKKKMPPAYRSYLPKVNPLICMERSSPVGLDRQ
ncbi:mediator of RNA polymerase II transcription subunit 19 isoform X4 [Gopherus flavomarginatus]|uniref:mediator of RNA polymerase II transcription subunit 19 isoform X4 n=1 Tax=Gopherus flavomarginatus TaxID=286002 RepID=UPI0021CC42FB|nr:mediator of RNA polymerase II transcription subunit 19 isoform X4 [Gopherus flavomarginatus]